MDEASVLKESEALRCRAKSRQNEGRPRRYKFGRTNCPRTRPRKHLRTGTLAPLVIVISRQGKRTGTSQGHGVLGPWAWRLQEASHSARGVGPLPDVGAARVHGLSAQRSPSAHQRSPVPTAVHQCGEGIHRPSIVAHGRRPRPQALSPEKEEGRSVSCSACSAALLLLALALARHDSGAASGGGRRRFQDCVALDSAKIAR